MAFNTEGEAVPKGNVEIGQDFPFRHQRQDLVQHADKGRRMSN